MRAVKPEELDVRHQYVAANGLRMHYVEAGRGPTVVLLHGFPEMWWSWRYQIPALVAAGFRVVAPDLRGYNETDARGPYDLDTLRDDVVALLDATGGEGAKGAEVAPVAIVGHDWGGVLAWHLAHTRQDRCSKLVVMNAPHPAVFRRVLFGGNVRQIRRSWYIFFFQLPLLPERVLTRRRGETVIRSLRGMAVDKTNFGREELEPFVQAVEKPGRASAMIGWYRAAFRAGFRGDRSGPRYGQITIPTLLLWGMADTALGHADVVPGTDRYVPGLEIQTLERCGHFIQQEAPHEVNPRLVEFLSRAK
jgi:pimeloyl-ACP methyl ester carboxylesterase